MEFMKKAKIAGLRKLRRVFRFSSKTSATHHRHTWLCKRTGPNTRRAEEDSDPGSPNGDNLDVLSLEGANAPAVQESSEDIETLGTSNSQHDQEAKCSCKYLTSIEMLKKMNTSISELLKGDVVINNVLLEAYVTEAVEIVSKALGDINLVLQTTHNCAGTGCCECSFV